VSISFPQQLTPAQQTQEQAANNQQSIPNSEITSPEEPLSVSSSGGNEPEDFPTNLADAAALFGGKAED
jgi:hypothetical protein